MAPALIVINPNMESPSSLALPATATKRIPIVKLLTVNHLTR